MNMIAFKDAVEIIAYAFFNLLNDFGRDSLIETPGSEIDGASGVVKRPP